MLTFFIKGLSLSAGMIVSIGFQNAHVLRMGLRREHVALTVLICIVCEALLILTGVAGMGRLVAASPLLLTAARWGGALFLSWYGLRSWQAAWRGESLRAERGGVALTGRQAAGSVLAVTLLNPHVYLDTVILLGAIGGQMPGPGKYWFAGGAIANAVIWFTALGFGARLLAPVFARPQAWRVLDSMIGGIMLMLAWGLVAA